MPSFRYRLQQYLRDTIAHRRDLIRGARSRRNELGIAEKLRNLEYWNNRLKTDKQAATFLRARYEYIKGILPKHANRTEPDGADQLRTLHTEALGILQPTQLSIFNQ